MITHLVAVSYRVHPLCIVFELTLDIVFFIFTFVLSSYIVYCSAIVIAFY